MMMGGFVRLVRGVVKLKIETEECPVCVGGKGQIINNVGWEPCERCHGTGEIDVEVNEFDKVGVELEFEAKHPGHCASCNLPTYVGDWIAKLSSGKYVHGDCA